MTEWYPNPIRFSPVIRRQTPPGRTDFSSCDITSKGGVQLLSQVGRRLGLTQSVVIDRMLFEQFVAAHPIPPRRLVLVFDAKDTPLHGFQEERFFHSYYDRYCYLPLYVFCGCHLLMRHLRPSGIDGAWHAWGILSLRVKALRAHWPRVEIVFRGDCGFYCWRMLRWCEAHGVGYILGIARNSRLLARSRELIGRTEHLGRARQVIVIAEHNARGHDLGYGRPEPHPSDLVADRCGSAAQNPMHPIVTDRCLSVPGVVSDSC